MRQREERQQRNRGQRAERTCFDFVLCLNKKHRIRRRAAAVAQEQQSPRIENKEMVEKNWSHLSPDEVRTNKTALDKTITNRELDDDAGNMVIYFLGESNKGDKNAQKNSPNGHEGEEVALKKEVIVEVEVVYVETEVHANPVGL